MPDGSLRDRQRGYDAVVVRAWYHGSNHCWVAVDGHVVDITATQFGHFDTVYVTPIGANPGYEFANWGRLKRWDWMEDALDVFALSDADAVKHVSRWGSGQSPMLDEYRGDLETMEGLAIDAMEDLTPNPEAGTRTT